MLPEYKIGLYVNPYARKDAQRIVFPLLAKEDTYADFIPIAKELDNLPDKLVVVGGEGSNRAVVQMMNDCGQIRPVGLVGGGTHDVLYRYLVKTGRVMTLKEFREIPLYKFAERFYYRPGKARDQTGKEIIFNNQFGLGNFEVAIGKMNARLRSVPQELRIKASRGFALIPAVVEKGRMFDVYSVSPTIGEIVAFPHQKHFGNSVTHATTEGTIFQQANNLAVVRDSWQKHRIPPASALHVRQGEIFHFNTQPKDIWIDGDTITNPLRGEITITRAQHPIPIVALVG